MSGKNLSSLAVLFSMDIIIGNARVTFTVVRLDKYEDEPFTVSSGMASLMNLSAPSPILESALILHPNE